MSLLKKSCFAIAILCLRFGYSQTKVITYNIKYDNTEDKINNWNDRKEAMVHLLQFYAPDIIGLQEVLNHQLDYLNEQLPHFNFIGVGREDGKTKGEYSPILYNSLKYKLIKSRTFWLSNTPNNISVGWDAALERICTYGLFEEKHTQKQFWVFNAHFDHRGVVARENSVELIRSKIENFNTHNLPVIFMGDLNLTPDQKPIQMMQEFLADGLTASVKPFYGPKGTFNGFEQDRILNERIDYIFVKNCIVSSYQHIDDRMGNNKFISDHLPVMALINFK